MIKKRKKTAFYRPKAPYKKINNRIVIVVIQWTAVLFSTAQASSCYLSLKMSSILKKTEKEDNY